MTERETKSVLDSMKASKIVSVRNRLSIEFIWFLSENQQEIYIKSTLKSCFNYLWPCHQKLIHEHGGKTTLQSWCRRAKIFDKYSVNSENKNIFINIDEWMNIFMIENHIYTDFHLAPTFLLFVCGCVSKIISNFVLILFIMPFRHCWSAYYNFIHM